MTFDSQAQPWVLWVSLALVSIYTIRTIKRHTTHKLPPGPRGIPFLGPLFQLSASPWNEFETWKAQYGPLLYTSIVGQKILVLNTNKVAVDLLDRRGAIYSGRPRLIVANEIFSGGLFIVLAQPGETWRKMRRATHEALNKGRVIDYYPLHEKEALLTIDGMLRNPTGWESELRRMGASTVLSLGYDLPTIHSPDDPAIAKVNRFVEIASDYAMPGNYLVEFFPWMKYIPSSIAKWKKEAEEGYEEYTRMFVEMFCDVENRIKQGDERPSFSGTLVRQLEQYRMSHTEAAWTAAAMYAAGSESAAAVLTWFVLAMIAYPEKQKKCQDELDTVIGRSRMPTLADWDSLPYLRATVREALRWRPVSPLGMQHCTTQDDWYEGYFIPKGTMCMANIWAINRDRTTYGEDADDFNPDRFLGNLPAELAADTKDGHVSYGFGPRICPGRHMANNELFISIATILWAADISGVKDKAGIPIIPNTFKTVSKGIVAVPLPFECTITPRFPEATAIIAQMKELLQ